MAWREDASFTKARIVQLGVGGVTPAAQQAAVADLNQNISAAYVEAEVQAISDKTDEILAVLRTFGFIASA